MISNMQQQHFDGIIMDKMIKTSSDNSTEGGVVGVGGGGGVGVVGGTVVGHFVTNNNNNNNIKTNKNICILTSKVVHNNITNTKNPNGFSIYHSNIDFYDQSSKYAKEKLAVASQPKQQEPYEESNKHNRYNQIQKQSHLIVDTTVAKTNQTTTTVKKSPLVRDESQEHAFRCIEDVHNYSKMYRCDESRNSSSMDEDDDDLDDDNNLNRSFHPNQHQLLHHQFKQRKQQLHQMQQHRNSLANNSKFKTIEHLNEEEANNQSNACNIIGRGNSVGLGSGGRGLGGRVADGVGATNDDVPDDDEEKTTPEHHARRPMNAFLIFCKRHRAIVRDKYKHLENRSITKILGDWWATLDADEKSCYTNLAKQYKDAFFSANPNFKWYKLPAPPLRTLTTRPGNAERPLIVANMNYAYTNDYETITGNKEAISSRNIRSPICREGDIDENHHNHHYYHQLTSNYPNQKPTNVGVFKLADEAQMGGLNSLMLNHNNQTIEENIIISEGGNDRLMDHQQKALHNVLSETSSYMSRIIPDGTEPFENMRDHATKMLQTDYIANGKRKAPEHMHLNLNGGCYKRQLLQTSDNSFSSGDEDLSLLHQQQQQSPQKKSTRSCKGKKYQEFMNSGQITSTFVKKTNKIKNSPTSLSFPHNGYCKSYDDLSPNSSGDYMMMLASPNKQIKFDENFISDDGANLDTNIGINNTNIAGDNNNKGINRSITPESPGKQFDASDFDLEEKIKALPAQILDKYLVRKRETKKKKKINPKRHGSGSKKPVQTIQEAKERIQNAAAVGSQKRKARKESITRRDISSNNLLENYVQIGNVTQHPVMIKDEDINSDLLVFDPTNNTTTTTTTPISPNDNIIAGTGSIIGPVQPSSKIDEINYTIVDDTKIPQLPSATSDLLILAEVAANHITEKV